MTREQIVSTVVTVILVTWGVVYVVVGAWALRKDQ